MEQLNPSDRALLQAIVTLTEDGNGRPPTLAELAVATGYQTSSRGNIQRQLNRLRPTYVDWSSTPRSLHVTPAGRAQIKIGNATPASIDIAVPDSVLVLLASGVTQLARDSALGTPLRAPYNNTLQRSLNILAVECLQRGVTPPSDLIDALEWCSRPPAAWPIHFSGPNRLLDQALVEDDQPSALCRELAQGLPGGDAELELSEHIMAKARDAAVMQRAQRTYVALRSFVIEHAVIDQEHLLEATLDPTLRGFEDVLHELYELVPSTVVERNQLLLCGHCGWTLQRGRNGRLQCGDDRCSVLTANFTIGTRSLTIDPQESQMRVRRAIRRYIVAPGRYEVTTAARLQAMGVMVELWPAYDRYDLRILFPDGEIWAVDVKDWRFPHLLANHLQHLPDSTDVPWTRFLYAVPDDRVRDNPQYLSFLKNAALQQQWSVVTLSTLLDEVRVRVENING